MSSPTPPSAPHLDAAGRTAALQPSGTAAPLTGRSRIDSLDLIRGLAALGILLMNAVSFGLPEAAYANLHAAGNSTPVDTVIGLLGRVFVDEKMMALFSLLFGVGVVIFVERADAKGRRPVWLSLWRNVLLLAIGIAHSIIWEGDILTVYAVCAPFVLLLRRLSSTALLAIGTVLANLGAVAMIATNGLVDAADLGQAWSVGGEGIAESVELMIVADGFGRALGLMLIGLGLFRLGVVQGRVSISTLRRMTWFGLGIGTALSMAGTAVNVVSDWSAESAALGRGLSTLGTVPMALGLLAVTLRWMRKERPIHARLQAVGRMALTNYISQTLLGLIVLGGLLDSFDLTRTTVLGVVLAVWAVQLVWSTWWLERFQFGPVEWLWRSATYRSLQPIRRRGLPTAD